MKPQLHSFILTLIFFVSFGVAKVTAQCTEFYGMTSEGGEYSAGTIFKTDGNGDSLTTVYSFRGVIKGDSPTSGLCIASSGKFYGTTEGGGILYEWDPVTNIYLAKFKFNRNETGYSPLSLTNINEKFYGRTTDGALYDHGIHMITITSENERAVFRIVKN